MGKTKEETSKRKEMVRIDKVRENLSKEKEKLLEREISGGDNRCSA